MRIARKLITLMIVTSFVTLSQSTARAEYEDAQPSEAAMQSVQRLLPGGKVQDIETDRLVIRVYEVEVLTEGREVKVCVLDDGTVLSVDEEIEPAQLPKPVADKIAELIQGGQLMEVEKIEQHGELKVVPLDMPRIQYELDAMIDGKKQEFHLAEDGQLIQETSGLEDDDHVGKGDDDDEHVGKDDDDDDEHEADDDRDHEEDEDD